MARAASPAAVAHRAKEGSERPERRQRVRTHGRRSDAPRLSIRAHGRRRPRHESEDLELVEGHAVLGTLPVDTPRVAARRAEPDRQGGADPGSTDTGRTLAAASGSRARALAAHLVELH